MVGRLALQQRLALLASLRLTLFGISLDAALKDPQFAPCSRDLDIAEVFTTAQTVVQAGRSLGLTAEPYDKCSGDIDACTAEGFVQMVQLVLRLKPGGLLCVAPDCSSFGFAPRVWSCRTARNVEGDTSRSFVREGNLMARAAMFLFCLAVLRGAEAVMENPVGSMMFSCWPELKSSSLDSLSFMRSQLHSIMLTMFIIKAVNYSSLALTF